MIARQHSGVEIGVHHDHENVVGTGIKKARYIKIKSCVAFAQVLTDFAAVEPNRGRMENSLELNSDGLISPVLRNLKEAAIPRGTKVFCGVLGDLPRVRNSYVLPAIWTLLSGLVPSIRLPNLVRIQPKLPDAVQGHQSRLQLFDIRGSFGAGMNSDFGD